MSWCAVRTQGGPHAHAHPVRSADRPRAHRRPRIRAVFTHRLIGGVVTSREHLGDCIPPEERAAIERRIAAYQATHAPFPAPTDTPPLYAFYPHAGTLYRDLNTGNFVDLDPSTSVLNYLCAH